MEVLQITLRVLGLIVYNIVQRSRQSFHALYVVLDEVPFDYRSKL